MAEKQPLIVIKKINVVAGGGHGGSWKVAFADFMTAMMAFFLLMWLLNASDKVKKNVSEHFSTPSVIEYNFANYGAELTLEKLFLDLINEPLKFFQAFIQPTDYTPNFMAMGSKKIVIQALADQMGDYADGVQVNSDEIVFEIPSNYLFKDGTATPSASFTEVMSKVSGITAGLEDSDIFIDSVVQSESVEGGFGQANNVASERLDLVVSNIKVHLEHDTTDLYMKSFVESRQRLSDGRPKPSVVKFRIKQKDVLSDGSKPRKLGEIFGAADESMDVYNNFVKQVSERKAKKTEKK